MKDGTPWIWELGYVDGINGRPMRSALTDFPEYRSGWYTGRD